MKLDTVLQNINVISGFSNKNDFCVKARCLFTCVVSMDVAFCSVCLEAHMLGLSNDFKLITHVLQSHRLY